MSPSKPRRQQGTGGLYKDARGLWRASVDLGYGPDGVRKRKVISSKNRNVAIKKLAEARKQVATTGVAPTANMTVEKWLNLWLEGIAKPRLRPKTLTSYRGYVKNHLIPHLGKRRLDQLQPQHIRDATKAMIAGDPANGRDPISSTSARHAFRILSKSLKDALAEGLVVRNVAALVDAPAKNVAEMPSLTLEQAITFLRSHESSLASRWAAALMTGARQGELLGLEVDRVHLAADEDKGYFEISWQLQRFTWSHGCNPGGEPTCGRKRGGGCPQRWVDFPAGFERRHVDGPMYLTRPKTKAGTRIVPLAPPLVAFMRHHLATSPGNPHGLVWARADGRPIDPSHDDAVEWHRALEAAGLPSVPLHSARHTTATLLLEAGVDARVIQEIIGHSSIVTTRGYQHVGNPLAVDAAERLGKMLPLD